MIRIAVRDTRDILAALVGSLPESTLTAVRSYIGDTHRLLDGAPFVDMPYREVSGDYVARMFGYASMTECNGAFGLPGRFSAARDTDRRCLFDLEGFRQYLHENFPDAPAGAEALATFRRRAFDSAEEFLLVGTIACVVFAERAKAGVSVCW